MKFLQKVERLSDIELPKGEVHLAIGMFDGVHRGHQAVIEAAIYAAQTSGGVAGVLTFFPHPSRIFRPNDPTLLIVPPEEKACLIRTLGADFLIEAHFTLVFAQMTADNFLPELKKDIPGLKAVYVGENFRFGKNRVGDIAKLVETGKPLDIDVFSLESVSHNNLTISSTRIREMLVQGDVAGAQALLGYTYFIQGMVVPGMKRGRVLGFPTLNFAWHTELQLRYGVYVVKVSKEEELCPNLKTKKKHAANKHAVLGVANFGMRPTFVSETHEPLLEVHLLEDAKFTEGDFLRVEFLEFLRPEQKFESAQALSAQIQQDVEAAKKFFKD